MAVWYDNANWFIFYPHGGVEDDKVCLYECLVQKGRIEIGDFRRLPPLDKAIDGPNVLTGGNNNSSSWALDDFQRLARYMKPKNMAVNCQGICYVRVFPMDTLGKPLGTPLGSERFWLRVFDLVPLNRFGLTPKPLMTPPRQELYIELGEGDPSIKVPGSPADVISDLERDRDGWKNLYGSLKTKAEHLERDRDDWKKLYVSLKTKAEHLERDRDDWKNLYESLKAKVEKPDDTAVSFSWKVDNFSTLKRVGYTSDEFGIGDFKWYIKIFPDLKEEGWKASKYVSIYIIMQGNSKSNAGWKVYAALTLSINDQIHGKHLEKNGKHTSFYSGKFGELTDETWGSAEFISHGELRDQKRGLLVNDTVIIEAKINLISIEYIF